MKTWKIFWGIGFILAAVVLILDAFNVMAPIVSSVGEISVFSIIAGLFFLSAAISGIFKRNFFGFFFSLALVFVIFEKNIAIICGLPNENFINNGLVFLAALLLTIGCSVLFSSKKHRVHVHKEHTSSVHHTSGHRAESSLGSSVIYIDAKTLSPSSIENNLGSCVVNFENVSEYISGGEIFVENNLGSLVVNVPPEWKVETYIENSLGSLKAPGDEDFKGDKEFAPVLIINGENSLGSLVVRYF